MEYPAGWTCEVTLLRLEHYLLGTLMRVDTLCVADHLEACDYCMHQLVLIRFAIVPEKGGTRG